MQSHIIPFPFVGKGVLYIGLELSAMYQLKSGHALLNRMNFGQESDILKTDSIVQMEAL